MFDKFQFRTEQEWIEQANLETQKFESISFPCSFKLEGLLLSAINTPAPVKPVQSDKYIFSYQTPYPSIGLMLPQQLAGIPSSTISQLRIEDIFVPLAQVQTSLQQLMNQRESSLKSVAVSYDYENNKDLPNLVNSFLKDTKLNLNLYNSSATITDSKLKSGEITDLARFINQNSQTNRLRLVGIRGDILGNQGATAVQELSASLSLLVAYWDKLTDQGVSLESLLPQTELALSLTGEFYLDLAKFKAARLLLHYVLDAYEVKVPNPYLINIRAISGTLNKSLYDPDTNLLRNTVEALAATLGEVDIISLRSHDFRYRQPTEFGLRMAANIQHLLRLEGGLTKAKNPMDGSYFFEGMVSDMVKQAWELFRKIEGEGGYYRTDLVDPAKHFHPSIKSKEKVFSRQERTAVGVTGYTNPSEKILADQVNQSQISPSPLSRWESIRLQVDALTEDERPYIAVLNPDMADYSDVSQKITFVIDLLTALGLTDIAIENSVEGILKRGQPDLLIFCGGDNWYQAHLSEIIDVSAIASIPKMAIGSSALLDELLRARSIDVVLPVQGDRSSLLTLIQRILP